MDRFISTNSIDVYIIKVNIHLYNNSIYKHPMLIISYILFIYNI